MTSPFLMAQQSEWYKQFLTPVIDAVNASIPKGVILDIGTGPGTLPLLLKRNPNLYIIGTDISESMIALAKKNINARNVSFYVQDENTFSSFVDSTIDAVTICSVLFLIDEEKRTKILQEVSRILKPSGKIIVLTPGGQKSFFSTFVDIHRFPFSKYNWTFFVWKRLTTNRAVVWNNQKWLYHYAIENNFHYSISNVFYDYAHLEIITKQSIKNQGR